MTKQQAEEIIRQVLAGLSVPLAKHQELQKLMDVIVAQTLPKSDREKI